MIQGSVVVTMDMTVDGFVDITDCSRDEPVKWSLEDAEVDVFVVQFGDEEVGHPVRDHPNVIVEVDLDVSGEAQGLVVSVDNIVVARGVRQGSVPAPNSVLVDKIEEHHSMITHDAGCCMSKG